MDLAALILSAQVAAARMFEARDIPSAAVVAAIIEHESRGQARACKDEANGSSSRGLMMINRPHSRCNEADNARFAADFDDTACGCSRSRPSGAGRAGTGMITSRTTRGVASGRESSLARSA
jgi:hypothetical protein